MSKPHATVDECLVLIQMRRSAAKAAMQKMIVDLGLPKNGTFTMPSIEIIIEYPFNMIYCVELILKLLANDWKSHNVGTMYETVFGAAYTDPVLMEEIKQALFDQKYLFEPKDGLLSRIADLENLFDILRGKLCATHPKYQVNKEIEVPPQLLNYMRNNVERFYRRKGTTPLREGMKSGMEAFTEDIKQIHTAFDNVALRKQRIVFHTGRIFMTGSDL